jgi:hypothetical protein
MRRGGERPSFLLAASPKTGPWYFVMMASREEIASRIDRAFEGASMPNTERELAEPSIDAPYVVAHFLGRSRMDLDGSNFLPGLHMEDFTYMT